ncbi:MAG: MBL fold metallo-hydrolase [Deltaproteobacteria bacterium]|nr:MAG: MBL fold metallo-hydrolase [Deltaproteobacteria bacterium]
MRFSVLGSGSQGNSVYVESGTTAVLIDAGFSGKEIQRRLESIGRDFSQIKALCITHEHNDHISGAGVVSRRYRIPVVINEKTLAAGCQKMGNLFATHIFTTGEILRLHDLEIRSFRISHDTADPVGFVISDGSKSLGYCTDTGKSSRLIQRRLSLCDAVVLEFNHDMEMLKNGPYPLPLQQRVRSNRGHLSNDDAGMLLAELAEAGVHAVVLAHLSQKNNTEDLARKVAMDSLGPGTGIRLHVAHQDRATALLEI